MSQIGNKSAFSQKRIADIAVLMLYFDKKPNKQEKVFRALFLQANLVNFASSIIRRLTKMAWELLHVEENILAEYSLNWKP